MPRTRPTAKELVVDAPLEWIEERSGFVGLVESFLFRKVPGDTNWFQTLGSATLTAFLIQALTGVILEIWTLSCVGLIASMASSRGKRIGDMLAGTFVIQERVPKRPELPAALAVVPPPLAGWAMNLELSRLGDLQTATGVLAILRERHPDTPPDVALRRRLDELVREAAETP